MSSDLAQTSPKVKLCERWNLACASGPARTSHPAIGDTSRSIDLCDAWPCNKYPERALGGRHRAWSRPSDHLPMSCLVESSMPGGSSCFSRTSGHRRFCGVRRPSPAGSSTDVRTAASHPAASSAKSGNIASASRAGSRRTGADGASGGGPSVLTTELGIVAGLYKRYGHIGGVSGVRWS